jgi:hypothetical protein
MRRIVFASACILAISAGGAFAQTQPAPGASSQGNVGPGAVQDARRARRQAPAVPTKAWEPALLHRAAETLVRGPTTTPDLSLAAVNRIDADAVRAFVGSSRGVPRGCALRG